MAERPLHVDAALLEQLQLLRAQLGINAPATISQSHVEAVEQRLGLPISQDVLAIFAMVHLDLHQIAVLTEELSEEGLPTRYVVLLEDPEGFYWCARSGESRFFAWPGRSAPAMRPAAVIKRWRLHHAEHVDSDEVKISTAIPVIREQVVAAQRVRHPRFGLGHVVKAIHGARPALDIDFEDVGRKRVIAEFVQLLDDAPKRSRVA